MAREVASSSQLHSRLPPARPNLFRRIGLSANPFRVIDPEGLSAVLLESPTLEAGRRWLDSETPVVEFVGQRGWGKSTHLHALCLTVRETIGEAWAFSYAPPEATSVTQPARPRGGWCIDEFQRIAPRQQARIIQDAGAGCYRLALGTHVSLALLCAEHGVGCLSVLLRSADAATIEAFVRRRIEAAIVAMPVDLGIEEGALAALVERSRGNLRVAEAVMYEVFQEAARSGRLPGRLTREAVLAARETYDD